MRRLTLTAFFLNVAMSFIAAGHGLAADPPSGAAAAPPFPDFRTLTRDELVEVEKYFKDHPQEKPFTLSQKFPTDPPPTVKYPWKQFDPTKNWKEYLRAVLQYCYDGNQKVGWNALPSEDGIDRRTWFHGPWLHWGRNGREALHGLTHERASQPGELAMSQTTVFQNWAVSLYNAPGGFIFGKVWRDRLNPDVKQALFPDGTVSIKLLFTQANKDEVPYLEGAPEWDAQIYQSVVTPTNPNLRRKIQTVRLLQIDIAVRDTQVDEPRVPGGTGWVFGTFTYNSKAPGATPWDKVEPVGIMWGNDPGVRVADIRKGKTLTQTIINESPDLPFQHLGWANRLNGPVDNPISSCLSCHSTAQWPLGGFSLVPGRKVLPDSDEWMTWFRNIKAGQPFTPGKTSLDYSLQLSVGIQNFYEWTAQKENMGGESQFGVPSPSAIRRPVVREFPFSRGGDE